ncbi:MAG: ATPase [Flavisolibacter sp.]
MPMTLIVDSGSTKAQWCFINNGKRQNLFTQGMSPYFLNEGKMALLMTNEVKIKVKKPIEKIFFYGTGCSNPKNSAIVNRALKTVFPGAQIKVETDLMGAARATCGNQKGIATILGTGSNSCYYNGKKIIRNSPGIGYILGDEASGAYLGKKVLQFFLYNSFDDDLMQRFKTRYALNANLILESVYKQPLANRYLASFALFLAENRGHYMIENIIEDGINDFFFQHLCKFPEVWKYPVHFVGSIAFGFKDVIQELCRSYEFELGIIIKEPMNGLITYHQKK